MDEASAWRELAARFRELWDADQAQLRLCALWNSIPVTSTGKQWVLTGASDESLIESFTWAAERAAVLLGQPVGTAALFYWLDLLKENSPRYRGGGRRGVPQGESFVQTSESGTIADLCLASAEYCYKLETAAIDEARSSAAKIELISANARARAAARAHEEYLVEKIKSELRLKDSLADAANTVDEPLTPHAPLDRRAGNHVESMAAQLNLLHDESGLTVEELAEEVGIEARSVFRHFSGKVKPYKRNISAYERVFSKLLKRQVIIRKMS